jgi:hypothetical protein
VWSARNVAAEIIPPAGGVRCRRFRYFAILVAPHRKGFAHAPEALCWADRRTAGQERNHRVLNRYDHRSAPGEAEIRYLDGDFRVVRPGAFVRCAITGVAIPLEELKYWSVERQEPYASPEAVLQQLYPGRGK